MLTTKEFADLCATTKKTIIHYDRVGLLQPSAKDERGWRAYLPKQVLTFQKIQMLKSFGLPLNEIQKYLNKDSLLLKLFASQKAELAGKQTVLAKRITKLTEFIQALKTNQLLIVPKIKTVKSYAIYAIDKTGRYVDIHRHQMELFAKIGEAKKARSIGLTLFYKGHYSPHDAVMTTGAIISGKPKNIAGVKIIRMPSYQAVTYTHVGSYSYLSYVWQFMNRYMAENKIKYHASLPPCIEWYIHGPLGGYKEDDYVTELQIAILSNTKL